MANRHFGKIGDIWKHLPLAEILSIEKPKQYWETNAGSAQYTLTHSLERDYGIFYFYEHAVSSDALRLSKYFQLLDSLDKEDGFPKIFPGSTYIAMSLLDSNVEQFIFCDIDNGSLQNIRETASQLHISEKNLSCINSDGVTKLLDRASSLQSAKRSDIFIQCDPCGGFVGDTYFFDDPFDESSRMSPIEFFFKMSKLGFKVMFWYGFQSSKDRVHNHQKIRSFIDGKDINLWCGEIVLSIIDNPELKFDPGVKGCGILLGNIGEHTLSTCSSLGTELAVIYSSASFPDGSSGAINFVTVNLNHK